MISFWMAKRMREKEMNRLLTNCRSKLVRDSLHLQVANKFAPTTTVSEPLALP